MSGEELLIFKAWARLKRIIDKKCIIGVIFCPIFWIANFYISLLFISVLKEQRTTWVLCFFLTVFFDLVIGEIFVEGICAFLYSIRLKYNYWRNLGERFNRFRRFRTMWP